jgi:hypothetical protein
MEEVPVKKECISWFHFAVNQIVAFCCLDYSHRIRTFLIPCGCMVDTAKCVGAAENLQTSIGPCRSIDRDQATGHIGVQATVGVPVAIVLMPFPSPTDSGFFEHHLVMVVIDLITQQVSHRTGNPLRSHNGGVRRLVIEVISER